MECFVPTCSNNEQSTPEKVFIRLRESLKQEWCVQANAKYTKTSILFCCEDHLDLKEDLENYYKWKLLKDKPLLKMSAKIRLQSNYNKENVDNNSSTSTLIRKAPNLSKLLLAPVKMEVSLKRKHDYSMMPSTSSSTIPMRIDSSTQCEVKMVDKQTNYKIRKIKVATVSLSDNEVSTEEMRSSPSFYGSTESTMETETEVKEDKVHHVRDQMLDLIHKKPKMYLGIPLQYWWIINFILLKSTVKTTALCIIVTLFKIKQNDTHERMCDQFQLSKQKLTAMFMLGVKVLASFFQNLVYLPTKLQIKKNLPSVFKINYSSVQLIIDCFEIEIQKPYDPVKQAQTWSQYKSCNTVKYLIGATPNGLVSFISEGYGGRISDKAIVEKSKLIDCLPHNAVVMADRGFKEVEAALATKNIKILRPPSVFSGIKPTKEQVLQTKAIASLRIHIERIIRRVREFKLLKPHSVVHYSFVGYLDEIVLIACGLINLQGEIIKNHSL